MGFLFPSCKVDINYIFVIFALIYERIKMLISSDHCNLLIAIFVSLSYDIIMMFIMFEWRLRQNTCVCMISPQ